MTSDGSMSLGRLNLRQLCWISAMWRCVKAKYYRHMLNTGNQSFHYLVERFPNQPTAWGWVSYEMPNGSECGPAANEGGFSPGILTSECDQMLRIRNGCE